MSLITGLVFMEPSVFGPKPAEIRPMSKAFLSTLCDIPSEFT